MDLNILNFVKITWSFHNGIKAYFTQLNILVESAVPTAKQEMNMI